MEPPFRQGSGITRRTARALKPAITFSRQVQSHKHFSVLLGLLMLLSVSQILQKFRKSATTEEGQTRLHPQAPWNLIPLHWLRRTRYTSAAPVDWTSAPVRLGILRSTSIRTGDGEDQARLRYIRTRPDSVLDYQPIKPGSTNRRRTFQEHLGDLWFKPLWRENGPLPTREGAEESVRTSHGEEPLQWNSDGDASTTSLSLASTSSISQHTTQSSLRSRFRRRIPRLDSSSSSDSESDPFTALGTDPARKDSTPSESYNRGTRLRIKPGAASLGMAISGAALAAVYAGEAGQEILLREDCAKDFDMPLPQAPQDISLLP